MNELSLHYNVDDDGAVNLPEVESCLRACLGSVLCTGQGDAGTSHRSSPRQEPSSGDLPDRILDAVVGTARDRLGKRPDAENTRLLRKRIAWFAAESRPIEGRLVWVPKKRAVTGRDCVVDLAELLCVNRLAELSRKVEDVYTHGLHYNLFLLDFEGLYIEGDTPGVRKSMDRYVTGLREIVETAGLERRISLIPVSGSAPESEQRKWQDRLRENYEKLKAYWLESEQKGIEGFASYRSYRDLLAIRWKGCLPRETRDYFLGRMAVFCPGGSYEEKLEIVLRNFSASLLHHQIMILRTPGLSPINFSFTPPAPRIPPHLLKARIDLRPVSANVTKAGVPPWAAKGFVMRKRGRVKPAVNGWREATAWNGRFATGALFLAHPGASTTVRADFLPVPVGDMPRRAEAAVCSSEDR